LHRGRNKINGNEDAIVAEVIYENGYSIANAAARPSWFGQ